MIGLVILSFGIWSYYDVFNKVGLVVSWEAFLVILLGAGITYIGVYGLIVYIRNYHLFNNPK